MEADLLGPLVVRVDGQAVTIRAAKERAVMSLLALRAGSVVSTDKLIDALWGENPPRSALKAVQTYVSNLRRLVPPGAIVTGPAGSGPAGYRVVLDPDSVDSIRFELALSSAFALADRDPPEAAATLTEALGLWRGPALPDLADGPVGQREANRLEELRRAAEEDLFELRLRMGQHRALVAELDAAVAAEPLRERRWAQLMLCLYRCGRQSDALGAYRRLRSTLIEQLGIEPSAPLRQLEQRVLDQDPALDLPVEGQVPDDSHGSKPPSGNVTFVFTDIEGSTSHIRRLRRRWPALLEQHRRIIRAGIDAHGGFELSTEGDGMFVVFDDAAEAIMACIDAQLALTSHDWPPDGRIRVRMGVHTGNREQLSPG